MGRAYRISTQYASSVREVMEQWYSLLVGLDMTGAVAVSALPLCLTRLRGSSTRRVWQVQLHLLLVLADMAAVFVLLKTVDFLLHTKKIVNLKGNTASNQNTYSFAAMASFSGSPVFL